MSNSYFLLLVIVYLTDTLSSWIKSTVYVFFLFLFWFAALGINPGGLVSVSALSLLRTGCFICQLIYSSLYKKDTVTDVWKKYDKNSERNAHSCIDY